MRASTTDSQAVLARAVAGDVADSLKGKQLVALDFAANHTFMRSGKSRVTQKGGAAGKNLFVGGLDMGVRADYG